MSSKKKHSSNSKAAAEEEKQPEGQQYALSSTWQAANLGGDASAELR